jgi:tyrosyl-tRNA synthetase
MNFEDSVNPPQIVFNHDWLAGMTLENVVELASNFSVQQMLERDMFQDRLRANKPIFLHEFLYPLLQGYDSVALDVDVELCGTDQIFNALVGRTLVGRKAGREKFVVAVNLMENPITGELMSKTRGTGVFLDFAAADMYGGIMAQPDEMIRVFLVNNTRIPLDEIDTILKGHPRDAKMRTAFEITKLFHGEEKAQKAQESFVRAFQQKAMPTDVAKVSISAESVTIYDALKVCLPTESGTALRRLFEQGAVKVDDVVHRDPRQIITLSDEGIVIKSGKRNWFRVVR